MVVIILIAVFAFNLAGYRIVLNIHQKQVRKEIKQRIREGISEDDLVSITVTPQNRDQLQWKKKDEFYYKGELYDIVRVEIIDESTVVYHSLADSREHQLIAQFNAKWKKNQKQPSNSSFKIFNVLLNLPPSPYRQEMVSSEKDPKTIFNYNNLYFSISLDINSPPPKSV